MAKDGFKKLLIAAIKGKEIDPTKGNIKTAIFLLAVPMILEMCMESIFALVDIAFVSRVSTNAVATIGLTESVVTLVYAVAIGLSMAATAIVARRIGSKDRKAANEAAGQAILLGVIIATIVSILGILFPKEILALMGGEPDLIEEGYRYTQILIGGNVTIMLLFIINAIFRGAGDASMAMWSLVLSNCLNIILDPIFIFGFGPIEGYGVTGAAIATTIGRGTAVVFQLVLLFMGARKIKLVWKDFMLRITVMLRIIKLSLGGVGQFLIGTFSWVILMRIMSVFGSEALAGYTISIRVLVFTLMPAWGMSNAAATIVGQNLGANQPNRAEKSVWLTGKYNAIFMVSVSLFYLFFAKEIIGFFSTEPEVIRYGILSIQIIATGYLFYAYGMVLTNAFNGAGDTKTPTVINFICFWMVQVPLAYLLAITLDMGPLGVFIAIPVAEILLSVISFYWFRKGKWKTVEI